MSRPLRDRVAEGVFDAVETLIISRPLEHALRFAEVAACLRELDEEPSPASTCSTMPAVFTP